MFDLRSFVKKGFLKAVGQMPDYKIILNSAGWFEKELLTIDDLAEINEAIESQYPHEEMVEENSEEEVINEEEIINEESTEENNETEE